MQEDFTGLENLGDNLEGFDNQVVLLGYYGGDKTHCLSAWQSTCLEYDDLFDNDETYDNRLDTLYHRTVATKKKSPGELLAYLADNDHHTPFEKSTLHFQVRADIATHIQFLKHRIGVSINTESARYKELKDKYYLPSDWGAFDGIKLDLNSVESNYVKVIDDDGNLEVIEADLINILDWYAKLGHELYHKACDKLTPVVGRKRAKETARYFLPYCKQLDFDVMFNFRSFIHFQALRNSEHAQFEIREIAQTMLDIVASIEDNPFELSLKAFGIDIEDIEYPDDLLTNN